MLLPGIQHIPEEEEVHLGSCSEIDQLVVGVHLVAVEASQVAFRAQEVQEDRQGMADALPLEMVARLGETEDTAKQLIKDLRSIWPVRARRLRCVHENTKQTQVIHRSTT